MTTEEVIKMLNRLIDDMANNVTGDEKDGYMDGVQACVDDVVRYIRRIRKESK